MKKRLFCCLVALCQALAPAAAQEGSKITVQVCFLDEGQKTFIFQESNSGSIDLLNQEGETISATGSAITAIIGDTVLQFSGETVRVLSKGTLTERPCAEVTAAVMAVVALKIDESSESLFGELSGMRVAELRGRQVSLEAALIETEKARLAEIAAAEALRAKLVGVDAELTEAEKTRLVDLAAAEALRERLRNSDAELTAMTLALEEQRRRAEETLTLLAAAQASAEAATVEGSGKAALLAEAERFLAEKNEDILKAARDMALLNQQMTALRGQLATMQALLDASADKDSAAKLQIEALGTQLNSALARVAAEDKRRATLEEAGRLRTSAQDSEILKLQSQLDACESE